MPLFSLSSKHDAVRSWYIDKGHDLGRFTENDVDQLTDVGGSTDLSRLINMSLTKIFYHEVIVV